MLYQSTRNADIRVTSAEAICQGLANDGGLFVPERLPALGPDELRALQNVSYEERAKAVLGCFLTDFSEAELQDIVTRAYGQGQFSHSDIAPVVKVAEKKAVLELWHGPTSAFKDMALQLLPHLVTTSLKKTNIRDTVAILVATSGDTGKAALEGFKDVPNTAMIVFYPHGGVSEVQRLQMVTQEGGNVDVVAVEGNFDDAQRGVKEIFGNKEAASKLAKAGIRLSSANSINWGRLVPQVVYYVSAYLDMVKQGSVQFGEEINVVVPTGNFGNILAAYYARLMGVPLGKLICASNNNNVLTEFLREGRYDRRRPFHKTISPSMDILVSSNLERLLYHVSGQDTAAVAAWMKSLQEEGLYDVHGAAWDGIRDVFWADWVDDAVTQETIKTVYAQHGYVLDPHSAVAWKVAERYQEETGDNRVLLVVSTASPFKFNSSVLEALAPETLRGAADEFSLLEALATKTGLSIPEGLASLRTKNVRHSLECPAADMESMVYKLLIK